MEPRENGVWALSKDKDSLKRILSVTENVGKIHGLDKKQSGRLRLLAEELIGMLPELLSFSSGEFWVTSDGRKFEIHVSLKPDESMTSSRRDELLALSTSGKNEAAVGVMNKIRLAAQFMLADFDESATITAPFYTHGITNDTFNNMAWSLMEYRTKAKEEQGENWDELEKSIIANIADDVRVGVQGKKVDIVVKKTF